MICFKYLLWSNEKTKISLKLLQKLLRRLFRYFSQYYKLEFLFES